MPCARRILTSLARRGWRRPITQSETEDLLSAYQTGRNHGDFETGVRLGVQLILASPQFVFRFERAPVGIAPGSRTIAFPISSSPRGCPISFGARRLTKRTADVLRRKTTEGPRDVAQTGASDCWPTRGQGRWRGDFAGQWLYLRNLRDAQPDVFTYPNFDDNLLQSMRRETELLFESIVREDRNVLDLLRANYTFVDARLAALRHSECGRKPLPPRHSERPESIRASGAGKYPHGYVVCDADLAGGAR